MGLLNGVDGRILPNNPVKRSEAVVILNRVLGASTAGQHRRPDRHAPERLVHQRSGQGHPPRPVDAADSRNFNTASTRAEAFVLMARAFRI